MTTRQDRQAKQIEILKSLRFGVEIETVALGIEGAKHAVQSVVGGVMQSDGVCAPDGRVWRVVSDGSLSSDGAEIVTPILNYEDIETMQEIIRALRRDGARVDGTCGIHVHVGVANFDAKKLTRLARMVARQEDLIVAALQVAEHRLGRYCQKVGYSFSESIKKNISSMRTLNRAWYGTYKSMTTKYDSSRYHGLNLNSVWYRRTVEFRYFNGTLHAGQVKAYVQLCLALCAKAFTMSGAFPGSHQFNPETGKYDMRVFLLRLGLCGEEFATARHHLLANLKGSVSRGRLARRNPLAEAA